MNQPSPQDQHATRLTAYALGELASDERAEVERLLAEDTPEAEEARREVERTRALGAQLASELARELDTLEVPSLTPAQRAAISRAASPARSARILRWSLAAACAGLAAMLMVVVLLPGAAPEGGEVAKHRPASTTTPAPLVVQPNHASEKRGRVASQAQEMREADKQLAPAGQPERERQRQLDGSDALAKNSLERDAERPLRKQGSAVGVRSEVLTANAPTGPAGATAGLSAGAPADAPAASDGKGGVALTQLAPAAASPAPATRQRAGTPTLAQLEQAAQPSAASPPPAVPSVTFGAPSPADTLPPASAKARAAGAPPTTPYEAALAHADRASYVGAVGDGTKKFNGTDKAVDAVAQDAAPASAPLAAAPPAAAPLAPPPGQAAPLAQAARLTMEPAPAGSGGTVSTGKGAGLEIPLLPRSSTFNTVAHNLDMGRLPPPAQVQISDLIDAAGDGRAAAPDRQLATIGFAAGGCPWQPGHQLVGVVILPAAGSPAARRRSPEATAFNAVATIAFNPLEVAFSHLIGAGDAPAVPPPARYGSLIAGQAVVLLFEVERTARLAQGGGAGPGAGDPVLLSVQLSYRLADGSAGPPLSAHLGVAAAAGLNGAEMAMFAAAAEFGLALRHPGDGRYNWERMLANIGVAVSSHRLGQEGLPPWLELAGLITRAAALVRAGQGR